MREGGGRMGQEGQGGAMNARGLGVGAAGRGRWPGSGLGVERMGAGMERAGDDDVCVFYYCRTYHKAMMSFICSCRNKK